MREAAFSQSTLHIQFAPSEKQVFATYTNPSRYHFLESTPNVKTNTTNPKFIVLTGVELEILWHIDPMLYHTTMHTT